MVWQLNDAWDFVNFIISLLNHRIVDIYCNNLLHFVSKYLMVISRSSLNYLSSLRILYRCFLFIN